MILGDFGGCIPCGRRAQKFATTEYGYVYHRVRLRLPPSTVTFTTERCYTHHREVLRFVRDFNSKFLRYFLEEYRSNGKSAGFVESRENQFQDQIWRERNPTRWCSQC